MRGESFRGLSIRAARISGALPLCLLALCGWGDLCYRISILLAVLSGLFGTSKAGDKAESLPSVSLYRDLERKEVIASSDQCTVARLPGESTSDRRRLGQSSDRTRSFALCGPVSIDSVPPARKAVMLDDVIPSLDWRRRPVRCGYVYGPGSCQVGSMVRTGCQPVAVGRLVIVDAAVDNRNVDSLLAVRRS